MFDNLTGLGYGIVAFAIVIGIGVVVLSKFSSAVASCPTGYTYEQNSSGYDFGNEKCCLATTDTCNAVGTNSTSPSSASKSTNYLSTQLGSSGLAGWAPAVIALAVGLLFLGAFLTKKGKNY